MKSPGLLSPGTREDPGYYRRKRRDGTRALGPRKCLPNGGASPRIVLCYRRLGKRIVVSVIVGCRLVETVVVSLSGVVEPRGRDDRINNQRLRVAVVLAVGVVDAVAVAAEGVFSSVSSLNMKSGKNRGGACLVVFARTTV